MNETSPLLKLNVTDGKKILKALLYSLGATAIGFLIATLGNLDVPMEYAFAVPLANALLVALKKLLTDKNGDVLGFAFKKKEFNDLGKK